MSFNSNFLSNFAGSITPSIDILTSVSNAVELTTTAGGGPYYGRYFCLGNLLIQFIDLSTNEPGTTSQNTFTMSFPIAYEESPYTVIITPFNKSGNNNNIFTTLISYTLTNFTFHVGNNNGAIQFLAIGPRPAAL